MRMMNAVTEADGTGMTGRAGGVFGMRQNRHGPEDQCLMVRTGHCEYNGVFCGVLPGTIPGAGGAGGDRRAPETAITAGIVAAPVFREIVHESFNYLNIPPELFPKSSSRLPTKRQRKSGA